MPKPFNVDELVARVRAALRRVAYAVQDGVGRTISVGRLVIDTAGRCATLDGEQVPLSPTEYRLLTELARHVGQVLVYDRLLDEVWGPAYAGSEQLVHQAVSRLRHKIESDPTQPQYIHTEHSVGYVMQYAGPEL